MSLVGRWLAASDKMPPGTPALTSPATASAIAWIDFTQSMGWLGR